MPLYKYVHTEKPECGCPPEFELLQSFSDKPLEVCPSCGKPCHKVMSTRFSAIKSERDMLSTANLARHGFTQYKKSGDGTYEKTAGDGPQVISGR